MPKYVALLRGINVGGNNIIKMTDLKACFESMGCSDVLTYIQSGNVVFSAKSGTVSALETKIEKALSARFSYNARVVVVPQKELRAAIKGAPKGFGGSPEKYRYDVIFLKKPLTPKKAMTVFNPREGVDTVDPGKRVIYHSKFIPRATTSRIAKIVGTPEYAFMTIRNWNTTTKLLALMTP